MKTKKINQKPTKIDLHLKYKCPNSDCSYEHWLSLKETQTKNFKVVCDCGTIFKPKRIKTIKICYDEPQIKQEVAEPKEQQSTEPLLEKESIRIPVDILDKGSKILNQYGFTTAESEDLIRKSYEKDPTTDIVLLVKNCIKLFGG